MNGLAEIEERAERGLDSLECVAALLGAITTCTAVTPVHLAQLLTLIHGELRTALPGAVNRPLGSNDLD